MTGETYSNSAISTSGAYQQTRGGGGDAFLVKFNSNGARQWGTYYGGSDDDWGNNLAINSYDNLYIVGLTYSENAIASSGEHQTTFGGYYDAFLVKFNSNGQRQWGTYYGGSKYDYGYGVTVDQDGFIYISGDTSSDNDISTTDAYQTDRGGDYDAFIAKFDGSGIREWGTYFGGSTSDYGYDINAQGTDLYLAAYTYSNNSIATVGAFQEELRGSRDAYLVKFSQCSLSLTATSSLNYICPCTEFQLLASDGWESYQWFGPDFSSTDQNPTVVNCTTGVHTYYVIVEDEFGCQTSAEVDVEIISGPNVDTYYDYPLCLGNDLNLYCYVYEETIIESKNKKDNYKLQGNFTFEWTGPNDFYSNDQDPIIKNATLENQGTYYVRVTEPEGCTITVEVDIFFDTAPEFSPGSNSPICEGETLYTFADIEAEIVNTNNKDLKNKLQFGEYFTWTGPNDFYSDERDPVIYDATSDMSGIYYLTVIPYMGCEATYEIEVLVGEIPSVTINSKSGQDVEYLCEGEDYNFDVTSDADYFYWSGPNDFSSSEKKPMLTKLSYEDSGEYTLTAFKEDGCSSTTYLEIFVNSLPEAYPGSNSPLCEGNDLYLFAFYNYGIVEKNTKFDKNSLQNGYQYLWTGPNEFFSTDMDPIIENATADNAGRYILTVKNHNGCENIFYVDVNIFGSPSFELSSNSPICTGGTLSLEANAENEYMYYWTGPNGFSAEGTNPTITGATPIYFGTYYCQANNSGCSTTQSIEVVINPKPTVTASSNSPQCQGKTLNLYAQGPTGSTYSWSGPNNFSSNQQNPVINNAQPNHSGNYVVTCTYLGCTATASVSVTINANPAVTASYNSPVYLGETIQFNATAGFTTYQWSRPDGFSSSLRNPSISNADASHSGTYTLVVTNSAGCTTTVTVDVQVIDEEFEIDLFISPELQKVAYGTTLQPAFNSSVTVSKYSYKWYYDEDNTPENGNETLVATTIHLGLTNIEFDDEGFYYLKVSYGNESIISNVAQLIVTAQQPKNNSVISRSQKSITIEWEDPEEGQGDGILLVVTKQTDYNNNILPEDGTVYSANSSFGDNSKTTGTKHYVVYSGSSNQVQVTNLTKGTYYRFRWFAFRNGGMISPTYNTNQSQNNPRSINTPYKEPEDNTYQIGKNMSLSGVYPNPITDGSIQFDLLLENNSKIEVKVLTSIGELVYNSNYELPMGDNTIVFDLFKKHRLASGNYILQVTNGDEVLQQSFIIIY